MSRECQRKASTRLVVSSLGLVFGLVTASSLARAEDSMMGTPMGQTPAAGNPQPAPTPQPSGQGMGTMEHGMGSATQSPGMGTMQPGMGSATQGQGMGMGMGQSGMGTGMQGQGMGMMGMQMMGGQAGMGNGPGMQGQGGEMSGIQNGGNQVAPVGPNGNAAQPTVAGVPQSSKIYHVGSIDFFLDQADKLSLTSNQMTSLTEIKRVALAKTSELQAKIQQSERELFELTGANSPSESAIANKVKGIEKLRSEQRLGFINSVGRADKVLTSTQKQSLLAH